MKTPIFLISLILFSNSFCQTTLIPDPNFEQALIYMGYDSGIPDGSVPTSAIYPITSLNVSSQGISDLTGIQDFVNLTDLSCQVNQLTHLDVSQNTLLTVLSCFNNQLSTIDLTHNPNLISLGCGENELVSLDISQNTFLKYLHCSFNQLTTLDPTLNIDLEFLNCSNNNLSMLNVSQNIVLNNLNCSGNEITSLYLENNGDLTSLSCSVNQLSNLNVSENLILNSFSCNYNQLQALDLSENSVLTYFSCTHSNLECLNFKNGNNTTVSIFHIDNNPNLICVTVDDPIYSSSTWTNIDQQTSFSSDCGNSCEFIGLKELEKSNPKSIYKIVDLTGREINFCTNTLMIYIYEDGTSEKVFELE